jgi:hypothetical protein
MAKKTDYIARLQAVIQQRYQCAAEHRRSVPVHENFQGHAPWNGEVEVFWLIDCPQAKRCFAWVCLEKAENLGDRVVTMLEIPPVFGPATAVRFYTDREAASPCPQLANSPITEPGSRLQESHQ